MEEIKKRRKILVTGSSGMLGTDLCENLSNGYIVVGLDIRPQATPRLRSGQAGRRSQVDFIQCDITDKDKIRKSIIDTKPDLVIHAAAWTDVDGCEKEPNKARKINRDGTENVVGACSKLDIPLVYISTDFIFDGNKKLPYTEKDTPNPVNVYGKSKFEGEKKTAELNKYIILRSSWIYGKNGKNFVYMILEKAQKKKKLKVVDDQVGSPTYTMDLARAIGRLLGIVTGHKSPLDFARDRQATSRIWGIYHISNKGTVSRFDYANEILKIAGLRDAEVIPIKTSESDRPAKRPAFSALDNTKFERTFKFKMRKWQEALTEYINAKT